MVIHDAFIKLGRLPLPFVRKAMLPKPANVLVAGAPGSEPNRFFSASQRPGVENTECSHSAAHITGSTSPMRC
jgi:hypothetical protein